MNSDFPEFLLRKTSSFKNVTTPSVPLTDPMNHNVEEIIGSSEGIIWYWRLTPRRMDAVMMFTEGTLENSGTGVVTKGASETMSIAKLQHTWRQTVQEFKVKVESRRSGQGWCEAQVLTYSWNDVELFQLHQCIFYIKIAFLTKLWGHKLLAASV